MGLCHISELSDEHLDNIEGKYRAGDKVVAKVLKVSFTLSVFFFFFSFKPILGE